MESDAELVNGNVILKWIPISMRHTTIKLKPKCVIKSIYSKQINWFRVNEHKKTEYLSKKILWLIWMLSFSLWLYWFFDVAPRIRHFTTIYVYDIVSVSNQFSKSRKCRATPRIELSGCSMRVKWLDIEEEHTTACALFSSLIIIYERTKKKKKSFHLLGLFSWAALPMIINFPQRLTVRAPWI